MQNTLLGSQLTTSTIAISFCATVCFTPVTSTAAGYVLSTGAGKSEYQIVWDVQNGRLDSSNLSPRVAKQLFRFIKNPVPPFMKDVPPNSPGPSLSSILQSRLEKVCPGFLQRNDSGLKYYFRSLHQRGKLDWIVTTSVDPPETITDIMVVVGGISSLLPSIVPVPVPGSAPIPSVEMGCLSKKDFEAAQREQLEACKTLGGKFCNNRRK